MKRENIDLEEQVERCRRLARDLTDEPMRRSLEELADDYEARMKRDGGEGFMLRNRE